MLFNSGNELAKKYKKLDLMDNVFDNDDPSFKLKGFEYDEDLQKQYKNETIKYTQTECT